MQSLTVPTVVIGDPTMQKDPPSPSSSTVSIVKCEAGEGGKPSKRPRNRFLGIFLSFAAAFMYSLSALFIKLLKYDALNLTCWRFLVIIIITIPYFIHGQFFQKKRSGDDDEGDTGEQQPRPGILHQIWPPSKTTAFLLLQGFISSNQIILIVLGVKYLHIGDCVVIETSAPVFVTLAAWAFLREKISLSAVLLAVVALVGVGIISKPPVLTGATSMDHDDLTGVICSVGSMVLLTVSYVLLRYLRTVHHSLLLLMTATMGLVQSGLIGWAMGLIQPPANIYEVWMIAASALVSATGQTFTILALKYEQAGVVALVRASEAIFCYFWDALFLHHQPDLFSVIGAALTLSCVAASALQKINFSSGNKKEGPSASN